MAIFAIVEVESHSCKDKSRSTNGIFVPVRLHCIALHSCMLPILLKTHEQFYIYGHVLHYSYISFDKNAQLIENVFVAILEFLLYSSYFCFAKIIWEILFVSVISFYLVFDWNLHR